MSKFFKAVKTIAVAALCAVGMLSMSGCENYSKMFRDKPEEYISMAMGNTMESIGGKTFTEEKKLLEQALEDGSFSLGFEAEGITFNGVCEVSEKLGAVSQMYTLSNAEGKSAQIYFYTDKSGLKLGTIGDSGSHIYDVTLESFAEKLAASIFAPDSGSSYEMSETDYDELLEYVKTLSAAMENSDPKGSNGDDKYQKLFEDFMDNLDPVIEEKTDIEIGGETVNANTVTYNVTTDKIKDLLNKLFDLLTEDGQLDPETMGYGYSAEEFRAQFDEAMAGIEEISVTARYDINAKTHMLMQSDISLNASADGKTVEMRFNSFFGADPASAEKQTHTFSMNADGENFEIVMDVTHTENSAAVTANMKTGSLTVEIFTLKAEKNGEAYSLSANIMDEMTAGIEGTISASGNSFNMTIDKISAGYGSEEFSYSPKAKVNVKKGGEISVLDAQGEFLDITEEQLNDLIDAVAGDFEWLVGEDMSGYVKKSKIAEANANAKMVHTSCSVSVAQRYADGDENLAGGAIEGSGTDFTVGGVKVDMSNYLGNDFTGYSYGYANENTFAVEYTMWSKQPIPEKYKRQLTAEEQEELSESGIVIGCYPLK